MMESLAIEDYLKALYALSAEADCDRASTGALARRLNVTPGSVTSMLQRLEQGGLVDYLPRQGAELTEKGRQAALRVVRRK